MYSMEDYNIHECGHGILRWLPGSSSLESFRPQKSGHSSHRFSTTDLYIGCSYGKGGLIIRIENHKRPSLRARELKKALYQAQFEAGEGYMHCLCPVDFPISMDLSAVTFSPTAH